MLRRAGSAGTRLIEIIQLLGFGKGGWGATLLVAALVTLLVTLTALAIGAVLGAIVAAAKLSPARPAVMLGNLYTTVFRGVPELLVIYLVYFGGSGGVTALGHLFGYEGFIGMPTFVAGALAVGVISGAYQAEVYRGAFLAVSTGEIEAARAIGMGRWLRFRRIIMPQVLRYAVPGIGNVWQLSLKDSALVSVTGLIELMRASEIAAGSTRNYFVFYVAGGALYLALTLMSNQVFNRAETRVNRSFKPSVGRG